MVEEVRALEEVMMKETFHLLVEMLTKGICSHEAMFHDHHHLILGH